MFIMKGKLPSVFEYHCVPYYIILTHKNINTHLHAPVFSCFYCLFGSISSFKNFLNCRCRNEKCNLCNQRFHMQYKFSTWRERLEDWRSTEHETCVRKFLLLRMCGEATEKSRKLWLFTERGNILTYRVCKGQDCWFLCHSLSHLQIRKSRYISGCGPKSTSDGSWR